jgi:Na+-translocating ferredoxin:NAD+ oxidoreductase RnfD subunit
MTDQPSAETKQELVVEPAPHITGPMSKTRLMTYTFGALLAITLVTAVLWWPVNEPVPKDVTTLKLTNYWVMPLGAVVLINALIAIGSAVGADTLAHLIHRKSPLNTMSAAVFGLIVTLSYSLGTPTMATGDPTPADFLVAPTAFLNVAIISLLGLTVFKKLQGLAGRKWVNPAATAKLIVLAPFVSSVLLVKDHYTAYATTGIGGLSVPLLAGPIGWGTAATQFLDPVRGNGSASFGYFLFGCYSSPTSAAAYSSAGFNPNALINVMILAKFHGWTGGASSLAVVIVGIALFVLARNYIKWRVTLTYFVSIAVASLILASIYADQNMLIRLIFEVFIGSSIFLGFFMATDPATTPFTGTGEIIFGAGLGFLTVLIQTYTNFFGGSILALVIMNLTVPALDRIGIHKPFGR